jgi:hypothetical protein
MTTVLRRRSIACVLLLHAAAWCAAAPAEQPRIAVAATAGAVFGESSAEFGLVEARATLRPRLAVAAAVAYLDAERGYSEWQLRASATLNAAIGRWIIDDRNMLYVSSESIERYRNRLRATLPNFLGRPRLTLHAFDEWHFDLERSRVVRNSVAIGAGSTVLDCCRIELSHVWSDDRGVREVRYWLVLATIGLRRRPPASAPRAG